MISFFALQITKLFDLNNNFSRVANLHPVLNVLEKIVDKKRRSSNTPLRVAKDIDSLINCFNRYQKCGFGQSELTINFLEF